MYNMFSDIEGINMPRCEELIYCQNILKNVEMHFGNTMMTKKYLYVKIY